MEPLLPTKALSFKGCFTYLMCVLCVYACALYVCRALGHLKMLDPMKLESQTM